MLFETIRKDLIASMKAKDAETKSVLSMLVSEMKNKAIALRVDELSDADAIALIQKFIKDLAVEAENYAKAGRDDTAGLLAKQIKTVERYLPKMMSEDEIKAEIAKLEDKSMKSVMSHFKTNFAGKVDMSLVSKIARGA